MADILRQVARRATLQDIIEKAKEANQHLDKIENTAVRRMYRLLNYTNSFLRGGFRATGVLELLYAGYLASNFEDVSQAAFWKCEHLTDAP